MATSTETVILNSPLALVTNARIVVNDVTYSMANVTSVRSEEVEDSLGLVLFLFVVSFVGIVGGIGSERYVVLGLGIGTFILAFWLFNKLSYTYIVVLRTAGGEIQAALSRSKNQVELIVKAISQAMVMRG
jgi:hypothetical protein